MAGRIVIDIERCKGCGLCVTFCPKGSIVISAESNSKGYFPATPCGAGCNGCAVCAVVCPDAAIEVRRDDAERIAAVGRSARKKGPTLVEDRA